MSTKHAIECLCAECCRIDMDQHLIANGINPAKYSRNAVELPRETVKRPSGRRLGVLRSLLETKDLEGLEFPGKLNAGILKHLEDISNDDCRKLIDRLLEQPTIRTVQPIHTARQLATYKDLIDQKCGVTETNERLAALEEFPPSITQMSRMIGELIARKDYAAVTAPIPTSEGVYQKDGKTYKVQRALAQGSGNLYAKVFDGGTKKFVYAPGMVRKLTEKDRMDREQAKAFGDLYGICCRCGRVLTDDDSIARGMGSKCATKF